MNINFAYSLIWPPTLVAKYGILITFIKTKNDSFKIGERF